MKKIELFLFLPMLLIVQCMAENNSTKYEDSNSTFGVEKFDLNETLSLENHNVKHYPVMKKVKKNPRKTLLEVEAEARAIIAEEVAKVEIVKANALAIIARAVASVEIAKIREEQEKESSSDLF